MWTRSYCSWLQDARGVSLLNRFFVCAPGTLAKGITGIDMGVAAL
jgi:hypothetical protein